MIRQSKPLSYPIGTIPPSSTSGNLLPSSSSSQPSPAGHSTTPSSNQMMVMLPLHGGNNTSGTGAAVGSSASGAHLVSTVLADHVPLGCTVEESLHEDDDYVFKVIHVMHN